MYDLSSRGLPATENHLVPFQPFMMLLVLQVTTELIEPLA
jgi:hypothetical protein